MYYSIDAIENNTARLVSDEKEILFVSVQELPHGTAVTDIISRSGEMWIAEPKETQRRKEHAQDLLKKILSRP